MRLSELQTRIWELIERHGDVEVGVVSDMQGFTGSDFTVEVFDPWSGDYRSNHPEQPYMLRFDRRRRRPWGGLNTTWS